LGDWKKDGELIPTGRLAPKFIRRLKLVEASQKFPFLTLAWELDSLKLFG